MPFHYPGYNYCGPGTKDFSKKPKNRLDAACRRHDRGYKKWYDYLEWNDADDDFMRDLEEYKTDDPQAAEVMRALFQLKKTANKGAKRVTGHKRTRDNDTSNPKIKQHDRRESFNDDEPIRDSETTIGNNSTSFVKRRRKTYKMPKRSRKSKKVRRRTKRNRRNFVASKNKRRRGQSGSFNRKIAKVLNPAIKFEYQWPDCVRMGSATSTRFSLLFDPVYHSTDIAAGGSASDAGFHRNNSIAASITSATGDSTATTAYGKQFWVMKNTERFRMTNMTSGVLFFKVYYLECKEFTNDCAAFMDNPTLEATTALYPNTNVSDGGGANTYGGSLQTNTNRFSLNKITDLRECKAFCRYWKIRKVKRFKLHPNENHTVMLYRKDFIYDPVLWYSNAIFDYKPGHTKILIRVDSTITGSTTAAPTYAANPAADYMSYGPINVPIEFYTEAYIARKTTAQERRYQYINMAGASNFQALTDNAAIIGDPVQTGGADQAMAG